MKQAENKAEIHLLPDGRRLAYQQFGAADGFPAFYFHGTPSSRLEALLDSGKALLTTSIREPLRLPFGEESEAS